MWRGLHVNFFKEVVGTKTQNYMYTNEVTSVILLDVWWGPLANQKSRCAEGVWKVCRRCVGGVQRVVGRFKTLKTHHCLSYWLSLATIHLGGYNREFEV